MHPLWADYLNSNAKTCSASLVDGTTNNLVFLPNLGVLQLQGEGAAEFLQGYVSCDTTKLGPEQALFGALCDIKGRVIAGFYLLEIQGIPSLVMRTNIIESVKNHLKKYLVFSRCSLQDVSDELVILGRIAAEPGAGPEERYSRNLQVSMHPGISELEIDANRQLLMCKPKEAIELWSAAENHLIDSIWELADLYAGIILPGSELTGLHLPQSLNMTGVNGAVDFNKGCYLGQEIIARVEHRGALKRRLVIFSWKNTRDGQPEIGDEITNAGGTSCGQVAHSVESAPGEGLLASVVRWKNDGLNAGELYAGSTELRIISDRENSD